ncbi:MAG: 16S rRNA (uracil(1498)-N(3))-methyltransferase [Verrucomicrobia bacterium]|nr:16S rRNA (uracil(1498)-N(3))-methyltransferase [Verrucomicrobiota bacterium]MCH8513686.1 16S rRNA (uracil(1498)-N(3))-methyltransferase [Kiritimatiellia bacterium]
MWPAYRCFVDTPDLRAGSLTLDQAESLHLVKVRRAGPGEEVAVLNGHGQVGVARLVSAGKRDVVLEVERVETLPPPVPEITLAIGGLKQAAWDELLRHAVELGVNRIVRVQSDHAVADVQAGKEEAKLSRWREKMVQALKQSANPWMPELVIADSVGRALERLPAANLQVVGAFSATATIRTEVNQAPPGAITLWVGPEGDFSDSELSRLREAGARLVSLGPRILRAETAALAMVAAVRLVLCKP